MSNEAIIKELRNLNKVIDEIVESQLTGIPRRETKPTEPYYQLAAKLRDYGNDYAMENGGLTSVLYLAADIIEALLP